MSLPNRCVAFLFVLILLLAICSTAGAVDLPPFLRSGGTVVMAPELGELELTFLKLDLNLHNGADPMTVKVLDPMWNEIANLTIPDDGEEGATGPAAEPMASHLTINADMPGLYRVRFLGGGDSVFGMQADCDRWIVDAGILLYNFTLGGNIYFMPPKGEFPVAATCLHSQGIQKMPLYDAAGELICELDLAVPLENAEFTVGADVGDRSGLWHFDVTSADIKITQPDFTYWTTEPEAYIDIAASRVSLLHRNVARYLSPGQSTTIDYMLFGPAGYQGDFDLTILPHDLPEGVTCTLADPPTQPVEYATDRLRVPLTVSLADDYAGGTFDGRLIAQIPGDNLSVVGARFQIRMGASHVSEPLDGPIVERPYMHEEWTYGYNPDYSINDVYFDRANRPFIRNANENENWTSEIAFLEDGQWVRRRFHEALQQALPGYTRPSRMGGYFPGKISFDNDGGIYTMLRAYIKDDNPRYAALLAYTPDEGDTWQAIEFDGGGFEAEVINSHNSFDGPPPVLDYVGRAPHPAPYGSFSILRLYLPKIVNGKLVRGEPIHITDDCIGSCQHSGAPSSLVSRNGKIHIVWGEATFDEVPGVPTYIATYDRATGKLGEKVFLGYAPPENDVHNVPGIAIDSDGYIHVVTGAHGNNFMYSRSLRPHDVYSGWTEPVKVLDRDYVHEGTDADGEGSQTYLSLVCDDEDTLHIAFRQWRQGVDEYHKGCYYAALSVQSKPKDGEWGPAVPIVIPPLPYYSIYYHKLTVDRKGNLYLTYSYKTADKAYQQSFPDIHFKRALVTSHDHGKTWKLAETADFAAQID